MKKILLTGLLLGGLSMASAQPLMSAQDMVGVTPMVSEQIDLPDLARKSLETKLTQIVTQNGFGSYSGQFVLTANFVTIDKQMTSTVPAQHVFKYEVSLYVVDVIEQTILDETSVEVTGIDRTEERAILQAVNQIKPRNPAIRTFMNNTREKIIDYYNTRIPTLLAKAQGLADRNDYEGALAILGAIPEMVDQYPMVAEQMTAVYAKMVDRNAVAAIQQAKGMIALRDFEGALEALGSVDPSSPKSEEAFALVAEIQQKIDEKEARDYADRMMFYQDMKQMAQQVHDDEVMLERMRIEGAREVGLAQAQAGDSTRRLLEGWFSNRFNRW